MESTLTLAFSLEARNIMLQPSQEGPEKIERGYIISFTSAFVLYDLTAALSLPQVSPAYRFLLLGCSLHSPLPQE